MAESEALQLQQPHLVQSISEEEEDDDSQEYPKPESINRSKLAYLLRYETMVRTQEAEHMASLSHIRPLLERIESLGGAEKREDDDEIKDENSIMNREIPFKVLAEALKMLESDNFSSSEPMKTDRQLMLVLRALAQKSKEANDDDEEEDEESLTYAEFYQCYKSVIVGMQTLQMLPPSSQSRTRARDRALSILSLFEPPSTKLLNEDIPHTVNTNDHVLTDGHRFPTEEAPPRKRPWRRFLAVALILSMAGVATLASTTNVLKEHHIDLHAKMQSSLEVARGYWKEQVLSSVRTQEVEDDQPVVMRKPSKTSKTPPTPPVAEKTTAPTSATVVTNSNHTAVAAWRGAATGLALAPLLLRPLALIPSPLQSLGILTFGGLAITNVVVQAFQRWVDVTKQQRRRPLKQ